ncbi:2-dehydro-3-deoxygalactonokinase [Nitratireductor indicus C115]|uniref:2-dehydro-3-deoxygalactonokinase n=1 Tax=Nitratireductor indicus C115 TaxID=1231190 RepID=K2P7C2_9HYPH|nr:2-dehydro-3-deoxygalactonokinase [Nitratireductor indicus]EKF43116.1 2-dehydro-3-deoxygalactonokinase [Nitratireductor indicus C115]SFQ52914.1 2-dehydro-3-deoxygalactonokinase [Nitratireductor indicus]
MQPSPRKSAAIILDWGTTSFRAFLLAADGKVLDSLETNDGIQSCTDGAFEALLMSRIAPWTASNGALPVLALGMITSRNGWIEVPYVSCPATLADLAGGTRKITLPNGAPLVFLAGLNDPGREPFPDVMRGEETQILGYGLDRDATVVLPGTHSKWARVEKGRIAGFQTFVTGEIFSLLSKHSFIARSAGDTAGEADWAAFDRGVATVASGSEQANVFLSLIFSARTGMLAGQLKPAEILDYVSGLLIAHEFHEAMTANWCISGGEIGIVGNDGLNTRYARTAKAFGLGVRDGGEIAAIQGALQIAATLDLLGEPAR